MFMTNETVFEITIAFLKNYCKNCKLLKITFY